MWVSFPRISQARSGFAVAFGRASGVGVGGGGEFLSFGVGCGVLVPVGDAGISDAGCAGVSPLPTVLSAAGFF